MWNLREPENLLNPHRSTPTISKTMDPIPSSILDTDSIQNRRTITARVTAGKALNQPVLLIGAGCADNNTLPAANPQIQIFLSKLVEKRFSPAARTSALNPHPSLSQTFDLHPPTSTFTLSHISAETHQDNSSIIKTHGTKPTGQTP